MLQIYSRACSILSLLQVAVWQPDNARSRKRANKIFNKMSDSKTYVFGQDGNQNGFGSDFLTGALLGGGGFGGFGGGANWLLPWLLFALWGNNGWGGFGGFGGNRGNGCCGGFNGGIGFLSDQLNNDAGRELIMQAIQGNATAISQLASTLNCNVGELRTALNSISTQLCNLGNQVGMSTLQVIQAINAGDSALQAQLASCCCDLKGAIADNKYSTERGFCATNQIVPRGFSDIGYSFRDQTCELEKSGNANTQAIIAKLDAIEDSRKDRELAEKDRVIATLTARSERQAELQPIYTALQEIQCNQPPVKKICCPEQYVPVNNGINATYGLIPTGYCGCGYGFPFGNFVNGFNNAF